MRLRQAPDGKFEILFSSYKNTQGVDVIDEAWVFETLEELMEVYVPAKETGLNDDQLRAMIVEICGEKQ
jgi:hypothetical protein